MAVVIALVDIYADHMGLAATVERIESSMVQRDQRDEEIERRLDQCTERVSRLQAFIEFRK